jgi:hypothetical protein
MRSGTKSYIYEEGLPNTVYEEMRKYLKGLGNEADFLGLLQKLVPHESLPLLFQPFRF